MDSVVCVFLLTINHESSGSLSLYLRDGQVFISLSSLEALLSLSVLQREVQVGGRGPGHLGRADEMGGAQHIYPLLASSGRAQLGQTVADRQ